MKKAERLRCLPDRRPEGAGASPEARLFLFGMQRQGFAFELHEDGKGVRMRGPRGRFTDQQRLALRAMLHEIRDLLTEEERPQ